MTITARGGRWIGAGLGRSLCVTDNGVNVCVDNPLEWRYRWRVQLVERRTEEDREHSFLHPNGGWNSLREARRDLRMLLLSVPFPSEPAANACNHSNLRAQHQ